MSTSNLLTLCLVLFCLAATDTGALAQSSRGLRVLERKGQAVRYENSYALVVGINNYSNGWPQLSAAVDDAKAVAQALEDRGFHVELLLDEEATRENIMMHLNDRFRNEAKEHDRFVFYFSGHGESFGARNSERRRGYLVPIDGRVEAGKHELSGYISMREIRDIFVNLYWAKHILVVLDCCCSGLLASRGGVGESSPVFSHLRKRGVNFITAGEDDQDAADGLFTSVLLNGLSGEADTRSDGFVNFAELAEYVQQEVRTLSHGNQIPVYGHAAGGGQGQILFMTTKALTDSELLEPPVVADLNPEVESSPVSEAVANLTIKTSPSKGVRLRLVPPNGEAIGCGSPYRNPSAVPGAWKIKAEKTGYEIRLGTVEAPPDKKTTVELTLSRLVALRIEGTPEGAEVTLDGPDGFHGRGGLPLEARNLYSGTYELRVRRQGYQAVSKTVRLSPGKSATVEIELRRSTMAATSSVASAEQPAATGGGRPESTEEAGGVSFCQWPEPESAPGNPGSLISLADYRLCEATGRKTVPASTPGNSRMQSLAELEHELVAHRGDDEASFETLVSMAELQFEEDERRLAIARSEWFRALASRTDLGSRRPTQPREYHSAALANVKAALRILGKDYCYTDRVLDALYLQGAAALAAGDTTADLELLEQLLAETEVRPDGRSPLLSPEELNCFVCHQHLVEDCVENGDAFLGALRSVGPAQLVSHRFECVENLLRKMGLLGCFC